MLDLCLKIGEITYNEFEIDFSKSFSEQAESLTEDLIQIKLVDGYLLDIGWYPEFDPNGDFVIQLIYKSDWSNPKYKKSCKKLEDITKSIKEVENYFLSSKVMNEGAYW